jgi:myo-inositol-1(or 4)-monophosphatase
MMQAVRVGAATHTRQHDVGRIREALCVVLSFLSDLSLSDVQVTRTDAAGPTTSVDREINRILHGILPRADEGWLSEESTDDLKRLGFRRVWIVDPLDGTCEFLSGIPEWCVSVALVEDQRAVAGGVLNPSTGELFLGSEETGLTVENMGPNRNAAAPLENSSLLVSRNEHAAGRWRNLNAIPFKVVPLGSVAYRMARVAAGYAGATCTFLPRHEWDVAGGAALIQAARGRVSTLDGAPLSFNRVKPLFNHLVAFSSSCNTDISALLPEGSHRAFSTFPY